MKEYHYHPVYRHFLCETDAHPSPRVPGEWIISADATTIKPPEFLDGFIPVFDGDSWNIVEDNRGLHYCKDTLVPYHIEDPNFNVDNLTTITPPPQENIGNQVVKWCCDSNDWIIEDLSKPENSEMDLADQFVLFNKMSVEEQWRAVGLPEEWITEKLNELNAEQEILEDYDLETGDILEENPYNMTNMTPEQKLSMIGLTVDDLKSLLSNSTD
jgi:hypothetical protein